MSEQNKYDEPWNVSEDCIHSVSKEAGDADIIAMSPMRDGWELSGAEWPERAARIVTCVNLFAGIPDPAAELAKLRADKAELLGALKDALDALEAYTELDEEFAVIRNAKAAITNAERQNG